MNSLGRANAIIIWYLPTYSETSLQIDLYTLRGNICTYDGVKLLLSSDLACLLPCNEAREMQSSLGGVEEAWGSCIYRNLTPGVGNLLVRGEVPQLQSSVHLLSEGEGKPELVQVRGGY